ncbi:MAG TPA: hypothetical protein VHT30_11580 [Acidimicrobiales bacterium]|nr:hypothetical protein [Acidimicrobiales bacterium]
MEWKPAVKNVSRPAARVVTRVVTRAIGPRLAALEHAHGETWLDVQALKAVEPPDARLAGLEATQREIRQEIQELRSSIAVVLDAVASQHAATRAAVRAEQQVRQVGEDLARRLEHLDTSP